MRHAQQMFTRQGGVKNSKVIPVFVELLRGFRSP